MKDDERKITDWVNSGHKEPIHIPIMGADRSPSLSKNAKKRRTDFLSILVGMGNGVIAGVLGKFAVEYFNITNSQTRPELDYTVAGAFALVVWFGTAIIINRKLSVKQEQIFQSDDNNYPSFRR